MSKIHRTFYYDEASGRSIPIEEVKLEDGTIVLVSVKLNGKGEKVGNQGQEQSGEGSSDLSGS